MIENVLIISAIVLSIISIVSIIFLYKALNKIDSLEGQLIQSEENNLVLEGWVDDFRKLINNVYKNLKNVDDRGIFEKDDDVGFLFEDILSIIDECNKKVGNDDSNEKQIETKEQ